MITDIRIAAKTLRTPLDHVRVTSIAMVHESSIRGP